MKKFTDFGLSYYMLQNIETIGWHLPTTVQHYTIPLIMAGRDVLVYSHTGTGKTGAFLIPIIHKITQMQEKCISAIILSPTRDLAEQTFRVTSYLANNLVSVALITPAAPVRAQEILLQQNPYIVVCTPGRLLDHLKNNKRFTIYSAQFLVLDECDKMLEFGFLSELKEIVDSLYQKRQTILLSATATAVKEIAGYALQKEIMVKVDIDRSVSETIEQQFVIINHFMGLLDDPLKFMKISEKTILKCILCYHFLQSPEFVGKKVMIFCNYKNQVYMVNCFLKNLGIETIAVTGDFTSAQRSEAIHKFLDTKQPLITTDLLARGIDIENVDVVIYFYLSTPDSYIHRCGRTGRAGQTGLTISLAFKREIEELAKQLAKMKLKERVVDSGKMATLLARVDEQLLESIIACVREASINRKDEELQRQYEKLNNMAEHAEEIAAYPKRTWNLDTREKRILADLQKQVNAGTVSEKEARTAVLSKGLKDEQRKLQLIYDNYKKRAKSAKAYMSDELVYKIKQQKRDYWAAKNHDGATTKKSKKGKQ